LHLTPIRGHNQRGFAFVGSGETLTSSRVYKVSFRNRALFCDLKQSDRVPRGVVVLDSRMFDELGCAASEPVELAPVKMAIPECRDLVLSFEVTRGADATGVPELVSTKGERLKGYIDSLIVTPGQSLSLPELGIRLVVNRASPLSDEGRLCRIVWRLLTNVAVSPITSASGFNLVCLLEFTMRGMSPSGDKKDSSSESVLQLVAELIRLVSEAEKKLLFAVVTYSTDTSSFVTFNPITGQEENLSEATSDTDIRVLTTWLEQQAPRHLGKPIRPAVGLEKAVSLAKEASARNGMHSAIVLFTRGTYSAGGNPVAVATRSSSDGSWGVFCVPLPGSRDLELIRAIAEAGGGTMLELSRREDMHILMEAIRTWSGGAST
jgi:hypothetical protein